MRARLIAVAILAAACALAVIDGAAGRGAPRGDRYGFFVKVVGLDDNGRASPLEGALVGVHPGGTAGTNAKGLVYVPASARTVLGDDVKIEASKEGFQSADVEVQVSRDTSVREHVATKVGQLISKLLRRHTPEITLTLPPANDAGPIVHLIVEVKGANLKPVKGALVALDRATPPVSEVGKSYTSAHGEATFYVPHDLIESGLRAKVFGGNHGNRFSDIPASVAEGPNPRVFLVVLPGANAFTRDDSETEVKNAQGPALTIDPGGQADFDHTGQYGGEGKGGEWKVHYTWQVPGTLTPGKQGSITLTDVISDVRPEQPLSDSINVVGPDLAQQLIDSYPKGPTSMTYSYTLSEGQEEDFTITVGFESSYVIYHYSRG